MHPSISGPRRPQCHPTASKLLNTGERTGANNREGLKLYSNGVHILTVSYVAQFRYHYCLVPFLCDLDNDRNGDAKT
jgi:hypothetical protein